MLSKKRELYNALIENHHEIVHRLLTNNPELVDLRKLEYNVVIRTLGKTNA